MVDSILADCGCKHPIFFIVFGALMMAIILVIINTAKWFSNRKARWQQQKEEFWDELSDFVEALCDGEGSKEGESSVSKCIRRYDTPDLHAVHTWSRNPSSGQDDPSGEKLWELHVILQTRPKEMSRALWRRWLKFGNGIKMTLVAKGEEAPRDINDRSEH